MTDEELGVIALRYVEAIYMKGYTTRVEARIEDPDGLFFSVVHPLELEMEGEGGVFVSRADGAVTRFGSGEWFPATRQVVASEGIDAAKNIPLVVEQMLRNRGSTGEAR